MKTFPKEFIEVAKTNALKRCNFNKKVRQYKKEYEIKNPLDSDFIGVLGEMLAAWEMIKKGKEFFLNSLFDSEQKKEPDIVFKSGQTIYNVDAKASKSKKYSVPCHKVDKAEKHNISHYWFFIVDLEKCEYKYKFASLEEVKTWEIKDFFAVPAYYLKDET